MTRRIAISILLTVYLVLILAGGMAYLVTRQVLVEDLDATLLGRIMSRPEIERPGSFSKLTASADARDEFIMQDAAGRTVARPAPVSAGDVPEPVIEARWFSTLADGSRVRNLKVLAFAHRTSPEAAPVPVTVVFRGPADRLDAALSRLAWSLGIYGLVAGLATAAVAVAVAKAALRPLHATAEAIGGIHEKNLDQRIPLHHLPPELLSVGERLNELLSRLQRAFGQRKQFLADASHELRTPLAALITTLEVTLHKSRTPEDYRRALESCLADARALQQLVTSLMALARSEQFSAGGETAELGPVEISRVIDHCAQMAATLAEARGIWIERQIAGGIVGITDELPLRTIATNLLSNAVEYTPPRGKVTVAVQASEVLPDSAVGRLISGGIPEGVRTMPRMLRLTVADSGPGIPAEHVTHVFEPFYRLDRARSQSGHHLGLGLFLVRAHARSLGGDCHVESAKPPQISGTVLVVEIPMLIVAGESSETALSGPRRLARAGL